MMMMIDIQKHARADRRKTTSPPEPPRNDTPHKLTFRLHDVDVGLENA